MRFYAVVIVIMNLPLGNPIFIIPVSYTHLDAADDSGTV